MYYLNNKKCRIYIVFRILQLSNLKMKGANDIEEKNMETDNSGYNGMCINNRYIRQ